MSISDLPSAIIPFAQPGSQIEVRVDADRDTVWATPAQIADAFGCDRTNVVRHIKNIYEADELDPAATCEEIAQVGNEGGREVTRRVTIYNMDVILHVGFRVNSRLASEFRRATAVILKEYMAKGFAINPAVVANSVEAQRQLYKQIRAIRTSEQNLYARVRDVFKASSSDYDPSAASARAFFAMAQDKFHFAITGKTAAQIVLARADGAKPALGMTSTEALVSFETAKVAKNYLTEDELHGLENISEQFLLFAESKAFRGQTMTMEELAFKLNTLLVANDYPVLYQYESYQRDQADAHVRKQLDVYRQAAVTGPATRGRLASGVRQ